MPKCILRWTNLAAIGLVTFSISSTGCRSGWKMPGADLFSFKRKPSESTIAGLGPSISSPTSPQSKYQPNAISSNAVGGAKPNGSMPAGSAGAAGSVAGYSNTGSLNAAQSNGYQTGAYNMGSNAGSTRAATGPAGGSFAQTNTPNASFPSLGSTQALPASLASTPGYSPNGANTQPSQGYAYTGPSSTYAPQGTTTPGYAGAAVPNTYSGMPPNSGIPNTGGQYAGLTAPPSSAYPPSAPSVPPYNPVGNNANATGYNLPPSSYAQAQSAPNSYGQPATASYSSATGYRPGSTGRPTGYDLTNPTSLANGSTTTNPYAAGVPNTAAGTNSPGYAMPPIIQR